MLHVARYKVVYLSVLLLWAASCRNSERSLQNKTITIADTTPSYLDSLSKEIRRISLTCYKDYLKLNAEKRNLDSIYSISLFSYKAYLELRAIIPQCRRLSQLRFFFSKGSQLTADSIILLANQCIHLEGVYCIVPFLPTHFIRNKLQYITIVVDTIDRDCDFSGFDSLQYLHLISSTKLP